MRINYFVLIVYKYIYIYILNSELLILYHVTSTFYLLQYERFSIK